MKQVHVYVTICINHGCTLHLLWIKEAASNTRATKPYQDGKKAASQILGVHNHHKFFLFLFSQSKWNLSFLDQFYTDQWPFFRASMLSCFILCSISSWLSHQLIVHVYILTWRKNLMSDSCSAPWSHSQIFCHFYIKPMRKQ